MTVAALPSRRRHTSGAVHLAASLVVLLVVMLIALRAQPSSPPPIAAFAPQVNQVIQQAPNNQTGSSGTGGGQGQGPGKGPGNGPGGGGTGGPGSVVPSNHGVSFNCYPSNPPRQIADPQSPPCVATWTGTDNGSATATGVTKDSISIAVPNQNSGTPSGNTQVAAAQAYINFFNTHFEFYGRKLVLKEYPEISGNQADQQTLADQVAAAGTFASTQFTDQGGLYYHKELAHDHIVSSYGFEDNPSEAQLQSYNPYLWSYSMSSDNMLRTMGNWYCGELNGKVAAHAGSPTLSTAKRTLGIDYAPWFWDTKTDLSPLLNALSSCGVQPYIITDSTENWGNAAIAFNTHSPQITSVMCICDFEYWSDMSHDADGQGYFPEWLLSTYGGNGTNWAFHFGSALPSEAKGAIGLTFNPRQEQLANDPIWWAWAEGCNCSTGPTTIIDIYQIHNLYRSMLELAAGIQMAGPDLTPQTFAAALQRTSFPDPTTPINAGFVDFSNGSHAMTIDAAEWWYDPTAPSPYAAYGDGEGAVCYVNHGVRHTVSNWPPAPDPFDKLPCDSGA